jgi:hypothetical protein
MPKLKMLALECLEPNDIDGVDEPTLKVRASDCWVISRSAQTRGETWVIDQAFAFERKARIDLFDRDGPDGDDHLGTAIVHAGKGSARLRRARFENAGARYELTYRLTR